MWRGSGWGERNSRGLVDQQSISRYNAVRMPTRSEVLDMYAGSKSWEAVGNALGVNKAVAWRYANESNWEPKREDLREALGLPKLDVIEHVRLQDGTFGTRPK